MSSQNYQELANVQNKKIMFFCSKLGINDVSRAERYLNQADWDENLAVANFISTHPNHNLPYNQNNNNAFQFHSNFQQRMAPLTHVNQRHGPNTEIRRNLENSGNYLEFNIGESLYNSGNNNEPLSNNLNYLRDNLKPSETDYKLFLKKLKERNSGVIIIVNKENPDKFKEQIKKIKDEMLKKKITQKCTIFSAAKNSKIGNEFVQQLSIVSYPIYIFCKYKDEKNIFITNRMEGAFDVSFFSDSILQNIPESIKNNIINNNKKNENNSFIKDIRKDLNLGNPFKNVNNRRDGNKNKKTNNQNNQILEDQKKEEPRNQNVPNNVPNNNININDYYLGDSMEIPNIINNINNNRQNNNINNNAMMNYNNNFYPYQNYYNNNWGFDPNYNYFNPIPNNFNSDINHRYNNNNDNSNNRNDNSNNNNNNNVEGNLASSIYGLSDGDVIRKQDKQFEQLEREHEKKLEEDKKKEELKIEYEKEANIAKMNLPEEPDENDHEACCIKFRLPDGIKVIERRFLKTNKIQILFDFVKSNGNEIFSEPDSNDFTIIYMGYPRKNLEDKKNSTLEKEGINNNTILQIQENKKNSK